jgi:hypothetical protein
VDYPDFLAPLGCWIENLKETRAAEDPCRGCEGFLSNKETAAKIFLEDLSLN